MVGVERVANGIFSFHIGSDDSPHLDPAKIRQMARAVARIGCEPGVHAVIVEGGEKYFCNGASRESLALLTRPAARRLLERLCGQLPKLLLSIPVPTIAQMEGHAIGGGFMLGLWCDLPVLAEESLYGANFVTLGITPGMGATSVLEEAIGTRMAREMLFTGRLCKGREFREAGSPLGRAVVARALVRERAMQLASDLVDIPRQTLVLLKAALTRRRRPGLVQALRAERVMHSAVFEPHEWPALLNERYGWGSRAASRVEAPE